jgi:type I restriction enzyme S subunit
MPKNWKTYNLFDFIDINPRMKFNSSEEYSFVEMKDLDPSSRRVLPSNIKKLKGGAKFQNGDTLFARITPCLQNGKICQVKGLKNNKGFGSTEFLVFRGKENVSDNDFVYYLSREPFVRQFAESNMIGTSGRQRVAKESFQNLELKLPPLKEQTQIANILSAIDDKIENNLATNKTLEDMAMALYKHWFVDFGPFQDGEFVESELGLIPKDWKVKRLDDICDKIYSGGTPKTKESSYWNGDIPWLSSGETRNKFINSTDKYITELGLNKSSARMANRSDTVIASAGQGKTRGQTSLLFIDTSVNQSVIILRANKNYIFPETLFVDLSLRYDEFRMISDSYSTRGSLTTKLLGSQIKLVLPQVELQKEFNNELVLMYDQINSNLQENQSLTKLRDTLLPKLINGEVRLKEFREQVENGIARKVAIS